MASPFDFTKSVMTNKEYMITAENEGEYVPFVANRVLSNYPDCIFFVQDMNINHHIDAKMQYDFYFHSIRQAKRPFVKYPKKEKSDYISLIMLAYGYSAKKAREAIAVLSHEQLKEIEKIYQKIGDG